MADDLKTLQENLSLLIFITDSLLKSSQQLPPSSQFDFSPISDLASSLSHLLRSTARLLSLSPTLYLRPLHPILSSLSSNLDKAQSLIRKCKHRSGLLRHLLAITTTVDIRKISALLESSIADLKWLLSIFDDSDGSDASFSLPPIAINDSCLALVWFNIAAVHHASRLSERVDAANSLASLAGDNDRNKQMIIEEDGIPPLLKLLKDGASPESQIAATAALYNLATDQEKVAAFIRLHVVPILVQVLNDSPIRVRINVINLVSRLVEMGSWVQEEFGKENVMRPIVTFLAIDLVLDDLYTPCSSKPTSIHSLVQINKEISRNRCFNSSSSLHDKQEKDLDSPEDKMELKLSCGRALWKLAKGSLSNCRKITETKALLCLAKIIENETGELRMNCLMTVMELAVVAESNADLRRQAFKPNSTSARAVLDQLLVLINQESKPSLVVPAIKSIGSLARTFSAKQTRIIGLLVPKIDDINGDVALEAVLALANFVCPDNFNGVQHSKTVLEFEGVPCLMSFLRRNDNKGQVHGLKLLCYLALHVGNSKALEEATALSVIEYAARSVVTQYPELKDLFAKAIHHLNLYQAGTHTHGVSRFDVLGVV